MAALKIGIAVLS